MDEPHPEVETGLQRVLLTLRPYLQDLTLIGGWVPYLYRRFGGFAAWSSRLSFTGELDVLLPENLLATERPPMTTLLRSAGLHPTADGETSAVWSAGGSSAEEIEFLVPHRGPLRPSQTTVQVGGQPGLSAIMLPHLEILERHSTTLRVPITVGHPPHPGIAALDVRVPTLGAYVLNKAITFPLRMPRSGESTNPKRDKDLLYLRDLAAAGLPVMAAIEADIRRMLRADPVLQHSVDIAASRLEAFARSLGDLTGVARILQERESNRSLAAAEQDIRGYLTDLFELLATFRTPTPSQEPDAEP